MQTTFLSFKGSLLNIAAATETAPAPSATIFLRSMRVTIAVAISSFGNGKYVVHVLFGQLVGQRAGVLDGDSVGNGVDLVKGYRRLPSLTDLYILGAPSACTP